MFLKIIHTEWCDNIELNFNTKRLKRLDVLNEHGKFELNNNILNIKWDKWDEEVFISHYNNNIFYLSSKINFIHDNWCDYCYVDYKNKFIYRTSNDNYGIILNNVNDELEIEWNVVDNENDNDNNNNNDIYINNGMIPNIIHFVYGFKEQKEEFELYRYLAIKSAYEVNKPDKIYFYYEFEPFGYWWEQSKKYLTLEKIIPPNEIFGNTLYHYAHKADIIRLKMLNERGGIYLDIDTICLKSFKDLFEYDFIMGTQMNKGETEIYGLCNAVILARPNSNFGLKWYESYKNFRF